MTKELERAIRHIKTRADAWAVKEVTDALEQLQCEDAISRKDLGLTDFEIVMCNGDYKQALEMLIDKIQKAPSVTPSRRKGHWILTDEQNEEDVENDNYRFICSECQCSDIHARGTIVPYCWKCGAEMESSDAENSTSSD